MYLRSNIRFSSIVADSSIFSNDSNAVFARLRISEIKIPFYNFSENTHIKKLWAINICRGKRRPWENSSIAENGDYNNATSFLDLIATTVDEVKRYLDGRILQQLMMVSSQEYL
jgi:hypothetical protein